LGRSDAEELRPVRGVVRAANRPEVAVVSAIAQENGKRLNKIFPGRDAAQKQKTKPQTSKTKISYDEP